MHKILRISVAFASAAVLCGCVAAVKPLESAKWSTPLRSDGVELRLYQTNALQKSNPGVLLGPAGQAFIGETKDPAARKVAATVLATELIREGSLGALIFGSVDASRVAPLEEFSKPPAKSSAQRFVFRVAVKTEALNHLPMAWTTNQYWIGAQADLVDLSTRETIWQSSCWINLDPADKTRQITNDELNGPDADRLFQSALTSATRQCAQAMFRAAPLGI
jgi:hypothetical protein